jgi:hypothetical protein
VLGASVVAAGFSRNAPPRLRHRAVASRRTKFEHVGSAFDVIHLAHLVYERAEQRTSAFLAEGEESDSGLTGWLRRANGERPCSPAAPKSRAGSE